MNWLTIGSALLLIAMLFYIYPSAKKSMQNSPKGSAQDWMGFVIPLAAVIGFVVLLIFLS